MARVFGRTMFSNSPAWEVPLTVVGEAVMDTTSHLMVPEVKAGEETTMRIAILFRQSSKPHCQERRSSRPVQFGPQLIGLRAEAVPEV